MNLGQLRAFYEAARRASFSAAARALGVSQPAVSMQAKKLQEALGVRLYRIEARRLVLTDAGRLLLDYADRLFQLANEAERSLAALRDLDSQSLRISTTKTIATYFFPRIMRAFKVLHRGVNIRVDIGSVGWATEAVLMRVSDLGLVVNATEHEKMARLTIFEDDLVMIVAPNHPLARGDSSYVLKLEAETLIVREKTSKTREATERALREGGLQVGPTMELGDVDAIKSAVRAGLGVSILSAISVRDEVRTGALVAVPFLGGGVKLRFEAIRRNDVQSPLVEAFLKALVLIVAEGGAGGQI